MKASSNSAVKYEGTWANGLQDGYGCETYSDGGYYQGQMCRGLRHGYGVRKSAPYGDSQLNNPSKNGQFSGTSGLPTSSILVHGNSLQSTGSIDVDPDDPPKPDDGFKPNIDRTLASKNGFVLVAKPLDVPMPSSSGVGSLFSSKFSSSDNKSSHNQANGSHNNSNRRSSLTNKLASTRIPGSSRAAQNLFRRLRKQKSTSDLDSTSYQHDGRSSNLGGSGSTGGTTGGNQSGASGDLLSSVPFTLSPEELDITDPTTVETYTGEWKHDKRNGHGICERSDGLKYEGQWHNDMKCGYGLTTFKDGSKEEGKYKNNILIVDSKVKRFFQLGQTNIRQRIDDAVKMATQAQATALKKAEIADNRAATARDKSEQATTAALEAARDSQIAYAVARQYSESQQQQQQLNMSMGYPMGGGGGGGLIGSSAMQANSMDPMAMNNLAALGPTGSGANVFQIGQRRISIASPVQQNRFSAANYSDQLHSHYQRQQQADNFDNTSGGWHQGQQLHFQTHSSGVEPFNGRRGSFRGSSVPPSSNVGSQSGGFSSQVVGTRQRSSGADPFNDIFDHYKSSNSMSNRRSMSKQASLDQDISGGHHWPNQRASSVARQLGPDQHAGSRLSKFRMSSMDHAEENQHYSQLKRTPSYGYAGSKVSQQSNLNTQAQDNPMHHQFKHLVTASEESQFNPNPQQKQHQYQSDDQRGQQAHIGQLDRETGSQAQQQQQQQHQSSQQAPTPSNSSYILPQSTNSSFFGQQTPSPDAPTESSSLIRSNPSQRAAYYNTNPTTSMYVTRGDFPSAQFQQTIPPGRQRDVHSLAGDEHLYRDPYHSMGSPLDRTDFTNYDFTVKSSPRPFELTLRRTASLSRPVPTNRIFRGGLSGNRRGLSSMNTMPTSSKTFNRRGENMKDQVEINDIKGYCLRSIEDSDISADIMTANRIDGSQLTINSTISSSSHGLARKPSLQVRYDPNSLGGLMSREEVAALSHAQREHKRIEAELAEMRAKRPFLHFYLNLKEFISEKRFALSILLINILLVKLFADLIM